MSQKPPADTPPAKFTEESLRADGFEVPPSSKEPTMNDMLRAAGFKVLPSKGDGYTIGWNGPPNMRPKSSPKK